MSHSEVVYSKPSVIHKLLYIVSSEKETSNSSQTETSWLFMPGFNNYKKTNDPKHTFLTENDQKRYKKSCKQTDIKAL